MLTPYENNWQHLSDEFRLVDLLVRREVARQRARSGAEPQVFKGVYLSDGEIDRLLDATDAADAAEEEGGARAGEPGGAQVGGRPASLPGAGVAALREEVEGRTRAGLASGVSLAVPRLAELFGLTPFETQVLLVCLALEADLKYEKLFAYLQDDITRKRPSVELVLRLLCVTREERLRARACFAPQAPLFRSRLLRFAEGGGDAPLLARLVQLDERTADFILGPVGVGREAAACARLVSGGAGLSRLRWPEELKGRLLGIAREHLARPRAAERLLVYHFHGPEGTGRKALAAALCAELDVPLLVVDLRLVLSDARDFEASVRALFREAVLQPAAVYLEHFDLLLREHDERLPAFRRAVVAALEEFSRLTFVAADEAWEPAGELNRHLFLSVGLPAPDAGGRAGLWRALAAERGCPAPAAGWDELAGRFRLTPGQIDRALVSALNGAHLLRGGRAARVEPEDLYAACRAQSNQRLAKLARKLAPRHAWPDLVAPADALAQLRELCARMRHGRKVFGAWG
ncbi:MAG TPA: AAA family ATPase, partial [Pyrinomonadaceae bacterium]